VEIDGKVVGTLKPFGQATRTAFAVKDGDHVVRVLHPTIASHPQTVTTGTGARHVMLILDIREEMNEAGESELALAFQ
jgi:hypothetical protein